MAKNPPAEQETQEVVSIPGLGTFSGEGMATHSSFLAGKIPWIEDADGLQSIGSQGVRHN